MAKDSKPQWIDVGAADELGKKALQEVALGKKKVALSCLGGRFGAISNVCNHVGGPLGQGTLDGEYAVCPWHYYKFHRVTARASRATRPTACRATT
jgi:nitrite reductase/ring-hydroxylating ferredoxin subunit